MDPCPEILTPLNPKPLNPKPYGFIEYPNTVYIWCWFRWDGNFVAESGAWGETRVSESLVLTEA